MANIYKWSTIKQSMLIALFFCFVFGALILSASNVHAQTKAGLSDEIMERIQKLLAEIESLRSEVETTSSDVKDIRTTPTGPSCATIPTKPLSRGSQGEDVQKLQSFLKSQGYFNDEVSNYFGPLTENAVKRFQEAQGVVRAGTPATTGYGLWGQLTQQAARNKCGSYTTNELSANTERGEAPLTVKFTVDVDLTRVKYAGAVPTYMIEFGDGTKSDEIKNGASVSHTYKKDGKFTAKLVEYSALRRQVSTAAIDTLTISVGDAPVSTAATISSISNSENPLVLGTARGVKVVGFAVSNGDKVYGSGDIAVTNGRWSHKIAEDLADGRYTLILYVENKETDREVFQVGEESDTPVIFSADKPKGKAPHKITFSINYSGHGGAATVVFGDGESAKATHCYAPSDDCIRPGKQTHTYKAAGTYTAKLINKNNDVLGSVEVTVSEDDAGTYSITDVKSVTSKYVDPIKNAADDEYTLYTITLKSGGVYTVKRGFMAPGYFEKLVYETGYVGDVSKLIALAKSVEDDSYSIDDVKSVTSKYVDPIKNAVDDEYTLYTITLKNGDVHEVKRGFMAPGYFEKLVYETGYEGDVNKLIALAKSDESTTPKDGSYDIDDVKSVVATAVYTPGMFAGFNAKHTQYKITLTTGKSFTVVKYSFMTDATVTKMVRATGYEGDVAKLLALAVQKAGEVRGDSTTNIVAQALMLVQELQLLVNDLKK